MYRFLAIMNDVNAVEIDFKQILTDRPDDKN